MVRETTFATAVKLIGIVDQTKLSILRMSALNISGLLRFIANARLVFILGHGTKSRLLLLTIKIFLLSAPTNPLLLSSKEKTTYPY